MAEKVYENHSTSAATILVSVVIVLIVALAFYFGVIRGGAGGSEAVNSGPGVNVELNSDGSAAGVEDALGGSMEE